MAVAWTALAILAAFSLGLLGLMATMLGRFDAVNARIDGLGAHLDRSDSAHEDIRAEIRALGDRLERRIDQHEARFHAG